MEWLGMLAKQVLSGRACANHQEFIEAGVNIHRSKNVVSIVVNQGETRLKREQESRKWLFGFHCNSLAFLGLA